MPVLSLFRYMFAGNSFALQIQNFRVKLGECIKLISSKSIFLFLVTFHMICHYRSKVIAVGPTHRDLAGCDQFVTCVAVAGRVTRQFWTVSKFKCY